MLKQNILFLMAFMCGCSSAGVQVAESPPAPLNSLEIFMSRATLRDVHFEQFKLSGGRLFAECGKIQGGRYLPIEQNLATLTQDNETLIRDKAKEIHGTLGEKPRVFEEPGSNSTMFSPGKFTLSIDFNGVIREIKTTHTSILRPTSLPAKSSQELAALVRSAAGKTLCGKKDFFELGSDSSKRHLEGIDS